ncbi:MAG: aspartate/glutamate racemase family protein, partial [Coprobacillus sp.]
VVIPNDIDIEKVNNIIYNELCLGIISDKSRDVYKQVIENLRDKGAEAVILGCTEIGLLIKQDDSILPVFDTAEIHAKMVAEKSIS